jgi:hypothetical protein
MIQSGQVHALLKRTCLLIGLMQITSTKISYCNSIKECPFKYLSGLIVQFLPCDMQPHHTVKFFALRPSALMRIISNA